MTSPARRIRLFFTTLAVVVLCSAALFAPAAHAQQTLGGLTGTVTDTTGSTVPATTVTIVSDETKLTRTADTNENGTYSFVDLPIGSYTLTVTHAGFLTVNIPSIQVQANRTVTVNAALKIGEVSQTVTVTETPLVNAVDTTNGYVMDKAEINEIPLPTGSFTGLATHSVGVNAELPGGSGANAGLGNAPVWANGQRDTSNTFLLNGVDAASLFNGKTTSGVLSARVVNNTGIANPLQDAAVPEQGSSSVYLAIGESLPSPAPESITEVRVNTSMYDAQQGSTSGAHIDLSTASGTNNIHGTLYGHRAFGGLDADPFFYNADPNIPANEKNPTLHRSTFGGAVGLPIKKDKLFLFVSYQHMHAADQEIGISRALVPTSLTDDRSPTGLANAANAVSNVPLFGCDPTILPQIGTQQVSPTCNGTAQINPIAYTLFNYKLPDGQYLIPSANPNAVTVNPGLYSSNPTVQTALQEAFPEDAEIPGEAVFEADQGVLDLDWNPNSTHSFAAKYYYQRDPTSAPFAFSMYNGFPQELSAGSQVISLSHTQTIKSNLSVTETFGFVREHAYSSIGQPFTPSSFAQQCMKLTAAAGMPASLPDCTIDTFGSNTFPGISAVYASQPDPVSYANSMELGATAQFQGADTGVVQNRFNPSANAIWTHGRHTVTFGGSFAYTQLDTLDNRNTFGTIAAYDFTSLVGGVLTPNYFYNVSSLPVGNLSRYWRSNESGEYVQDKFQFRPNLDITAGLRWDWDGGLTEKNGNLLNFDPSLYSYNPTTDTINNNGLIVAGNNKEAGTPGVSNTTLTGRQWGFAPRIGVAWSPKRFNDKIVVRAGWGMYYDRGELFTYLSPGFTYNIDTGGAFGVNEQQPFATIQTCGQTVACAANGGVPTLENPWGNATDFAAAQPSGNPAKLVLPNATALLGGDTPFYLATYARNNKLPYTMNSTIDVQWQPRNDLAIDIGYVSALGRHEVIPIPFNEARIASPSAPLCGPAPVCSSPSTAIYPQSYTYGYTVQSATCANYNQYANNCPINLPNGQQMVVTQEGGNGDLRVPYIGYADEAEQYTAEGISNYNALQAHIEKRLSRGVSFGVSYTYSRSMDEQSALGLFYNGNNPLNLKSAYGLSDFDRPNVINIDYHYELPKFVGGHSWKSEIVDGWAVQGVVVVQNGQPYSVIDYSGAVGSIYYSIYDGIINPIVPLAPGCSAQSALTGTNGANPGSPALNAACFTVPVLQPGALNGAIPAGDTFETNFTSGQRNIFRQPWQKRADISIVKLTKLTERLTLRYSFDVYNLTNTPSFDIPIDNVSQNLNFIQYPQQGEANIPGAKTCANDPTAGPFNENGNVYFYNCPAGLGQVTKTIGSSRQVQMSLALTF